MVQGLNTPSIKRVKKNYLPPFEDSGWVTVGDSSLIRDFVKNGYEVSFTTVNSRYMGMSYNLPLSLAGKTVSISVQEVRGTGGAIQLSWRSGGVLTNKSINFSNGNKIENILIPQDITQLYFKIQNNNVTSETYYFRGLQLEEGMYATDFKEQIIEGAKSLYELVPKKNIAPISNVYRTFSTTTNMGNQSGSVLLSNIPVKPNTTYSLSFRGTDGLGYVVITQRMLTSNTGHNSLYSEMMTGGNGRQLTVSSDKTLTFTTTATENYVAFTTGNTQSGTFPANIYVENVQIEEGYPTAFEPYTLVEKPISERSVPKKNLLKGFKRFVLNNFTLASIANNWKASFTSQVANSNSYFPVDVKPNTNYTFSITKPSDVQIAVFDSTATTTIVSYTTNSSITFNSGARSQVRLYVREMTAGVTFELSNPQLEEGSVATDFKEYELGNKGANLFPKKNLIKPFGDDDYVFPAVSVGRYTIISPSRIELDATADHQYFRIGFPVKPYTVYTVSANHNGKIGIYSDDGASGIVQYDTIQKATFNSGNRNVIRFYFSNIGMGTGKFYVEDLQLEEGSVVTDYEPYTLINRPSSLAPKKTPKKNLVPPFSKWATIGDNFKINSDYSISGSFVSGTIRACLTTIDVEIGKTYTLSGKVTPVNGRIRIGKKSDNTLIGVVGANGSPTLTFTATEKQYSLSIDNNYGSPVYGGTLAFDNIQLEEGSVATDFQPYALVDDYSSVIKKATYRNYPFSFKRESVEVVDSIQYGVNSPRIKDGGLLIEEGTKNLVPPVQTWKNPWIGAMPPAYIEDYTRLTLDTAKGNISAVRHDTTRTFVATAGKSYTISFKARGSKNGIMLNYLYFMNAVSGGNKNLYGDGFKTTITTEWQEYHYTTTYDVSSSSAHILFGFSTSTNNPVATGDWVDFKDVQVEEKNYFTSYTQNERKPDKVTLTDSGQIDAVAGSIEFSFSFDDLTNALIGSHFIFDTNIPTNRLFCNYDVGLKAIQFTLQGLANIQIPSTNLQADNVCKIEWNGGYSKFTVNGYSMDKTTTGKLNPAFGTMTLGCRNSNDTAWLNGVLKSFVVKDRNGVITYQI